VGELLRSAPEVATSELGWSALLRFQGTPHRMAFVRDASGRHVGIVTVADLVEEIMGEMGGKFE
jgi:CBS domain containing-hemolysin-like protein